MRTSATVLLLTLVAAATGQEPAGKPAEKPKPKFTISKETTYVTEPVDKDGYIDYVAALNERLRKSVTPENNAVVLLCQALGPRPDGIPMPPEFYEWLGIKEPPEQGEYYVGPVNESQKQTDEFHEKLEEARKRPWTSAEHPRLAEWLKANEKPLSRVIEASKRSQYFYPLVPRQARLGLMTVALPHPEKCRILAQALMGRAMLRTSEGRLDDAWRDLLACHRLARLLGHGGSLTEQLVAIAIEVVTGNADAAFSGYPGVEIEGLRTCLRDLQRLPPMPPLSDQIDLGERLMFLDAAMHIDRYGFGYLQRLMFDGKVPQGSSSFSNVMWNIMWRDIDWDPALREGNEWYDRIVAAMRQQNRATREADLEKMQKKLMRRAVEAADIDAQSMAIRFAKNKAQAKGKTMGGLLVRIALPAVSKLQTHVDRCQQQHRNVLIAFALAIYEREHGRYPAKLDELAPKYLTEVPSDIFTGKPLVYRPSEKGYLVYSLGPNGQDDEGRGRDDDPVGDDLTVRMPLPKP